MRRLFGGITGVPPSMLVHVVGIEDLLGDIELQDGQHLWREGIGGILAFCSMFSPGFQHSAPCPGLPTRCGPYTPRSNVVSVGF